MATKQERANREERRRRIITAAQRCLVPPQDGCRQQPPGDGWDTLLLRLRGLRATDHDYFSAGAMMAFPEPAVRTGHLSALVGELACSFPETGADDTALQLALARLATCSLAWLDELGASLPS